MAKTKKQPKLKMPFQKGESSTFSEKGISRSEIPDKSRQSIS